MTDRRFSLHRVGALLVTIGTVVSVAGCGRTLVFAERDGVNFAVRANPSASPPLGVNFGLERVVVTVVPPAGDKSGKAAGEAVNMFAGFQVESSDIKTQKPLNVDLTISTQFASGEAAKNVADKPDVVAEIVSVRNLTFSSSPSATQLKAWLSPNNKLSRNRSTKLQAWLNTHYPGRNLFPAQITADPYYEPVRQAALQDTQLMREPPN